MHKIAHSEYFDTLNRLNIINLIVLDFWATHEYIRLLSVKDHFTFTKNNSAIQNKKHNNAMTCLTRHIESHCDQNDTIDINLRNF